MVLILSKNIEALTGSLGRGYGYHIQRRKNGFFAKRNLRKVADGVFWLSYGEALHFSRYAGYDLTHD